MDPASHWHSVYATRAANELSWHRDHLTTSLDWIRRAGGGAVLDAGGGDSTLVDDLLAEGLGPVTVVDLAAPALERAKLRLGARAAEVGWIAGDITAVALPAAGFDIWHDRALFHFLRDPGRREAYVGQLRHALKPGGHAIFAEFAPDGPTRCSGLEVNRYGAADLGGVLGPEFHLLETAAETHLTPAGARQNFLYSLFRYGLEG